MGSLTKLFKNPLLNPGYQINQYLGMPDPLVDMGAMMKGDGIQEIQQQRMEDQYGEMTSPGTGSIGTGPMTPEGGLTSDGNLTSVKKDAAASRNNFVRNKLGDNSNDGKSKTKRKKLGG